MSRTITAATLSIVVLGSCALARAAPAADLSAARERCAARIAEGARDAAIAACDSALSGGSARDMRAAVAALMSGPALPTADDLLRATLLANAAARIAPGEPWGPAAHLDIVRRWGDPELIARRLADLERVAPHHEETERGRRVAAQRTPWGLLLMGGAVLLLGIATVAHALTGTWRRRARRLASVPVPTLAVLVCVWGVLSGPTSAQAGPADFRIDDDNPEAGVPTPAQADARPIELATYLQDLAGRGAAATERQDHAAAARYYRALTKVVPDRSVAFSRLCRSLEAGGRREEAIDACRDALARPGAVVDDHVRFVGLLLSKSDLGTKEIEDVKASALHLTAVPETRTVGHHLQCQLGTRLGSVGLLEECTKGLEAAAPSDPKTITFRFALALQKGEQDEAQSLIARARAAGVKPEGIERMEKAASALGDGASRGPLDWRIALAAVFVLAGGVIVLVTRSRRRLIEKSA